MTPIINIYDSDHRYPIDISRTSFRKIFASRLGVLRKTLEMNKPELHSFHIPVLGLGYSIDTPVKVARFGVSSVISIMDDHLIEKMRSYHCAKSGEHYEPITPNEDDHRARRITEYLNLVNRVVQKQMKHLRSLPFRENNDLVKYFELLPPDAPLKIRYHEMLVASGRLKQLIQEELRERIAPGAIDVNIMAKIDRVNKDASGNDLPLEYSDALAAFRGFALSDLQSSVVFSAGYNPRLYNYIEQFPDFFPNENGQLKKKIILKVSDFRSALVQGKIFAKKGLWISEFRVESGLNCGGHAFPTDGLLLGPILEEFKNKRLELTTELFGLCNAAFGEKNRPGFTAQPSMKITVQGGIGTATENEFLLEHYQLDGTGWGSPFLLVPEATNVDDETIEKLATARKEDYYLSFASPLGIPFNNFTKSSAQTQRHQRIEKGRPGSPCYKKFLSSDSEFTESPVCTASREYQHLKIKQLKERNLPADLFEMEFNQITEKDCLCEGLGASVLIKDHVALSHNLSAVTICPGPNLAYFSGIFSLSEMVGHIYGRWNILNSLYRPNMFVNELQMYVDYYKNRLESNLTLNPKQVKYLQTFKTNLLEGIDYYKNMLSSFIKESDEYISMMKNELDRAVLVLS